MGRPGHFFDQDADPDPEPDPERSREPAGPPAHAGRGSLYDQDADDGSDAAPDWKRGPRGDSPAQREIQRQRALQERQELRRLEEIRRHAELDRRRQEQLDQQADRQHESQRRRQVRQPRPASPPPPARPPAATEPPADRPRIVIGSSPIVSKPPGSGSGRPVEPVRGRGQPGPPAQGRGQPVAPAQGRGQPVAPAQGGGAQRRAPRSTGRTAAVLAAGTFASRLTGFLRVLAVGYVLGVNSLSDAFNYANGVPNIIYDLLIGGILSATLIPVFVTHLNDPDHRERSRSLSAVLTAIAVALVAISGLLWLAAPWVIRFYLVLSPSSTGHAERDLATTLLRYFAPQVFFLGTIVASTALLNAARRFGSAAISPVLNNLIAIAALLVTKAVAEPVLTAKGVSPAGTLEAFSHDTKAVAILGLGTTAGYLAQLLVQLPATRRLGLHLRPVWDMRHPAVRRVAGLSSWLVGVVLANQVSLALVTILAARTHGGFTAYQFGYQFFQLPYALVAVSVASAIMPNLADRWSSGDRVGFERQFVTGIRVTLAALIPIGLVYIVVAQPFIQLAIHHGRVNQSGAHLVTETLVYFAVGLPGFSAFFLLMRGYQAMQDARAMFGVYVIENALTLVAAPLLSAWLGEPGLALAWVGPYTLAALYAASRLRRRVGTLGGWFTVRALIRICVASAFTGAAALAVGLPFPSHAGDPVLVVRLLLQAGVGVVVYLYLASRLHIREIRPIVAAARRVLRR